MKGPIRDAWLDAPPHHMSDDEIDADIVEAQRAINRLHARQVQLVGEADRRRFYESLGFGSAVAWLRSRLRIAHGVARVRVQMGRDLISMPLTEKAFTAGDIDLGRTRRIADARRVAPEAFPDGETTLVDAARDLQPRNFRAVVEYWKQAAAPEAFANDEKERFERRAVNVSRTWDGMVRLDGWLDPESGAVVMSAIGSYLDRCARTPDDRRNAGQVRADALVDICRFSLDHGDDPDAGGQRPHLLGVVALETLEGRAGYRAELAPVGRLTPEAFRRIACDASITRIITDPRSMPLDVGRASRTATAAQRKALIVRDGGCAVGDCPVPPQWCDAHHLEHWADGGLSDLLNLVLLCRRHHRMVHEGTLELPMVRGGPSP